MLDPEMTVKNTVTIATDEYESTTLTKKHYRNIGIFLPANFIESVISFTGCDTPDGTFIPIVKGSDGNAVATVAIAPSEIIVLDNVMLRALEPVPYIRLKATVQQITDDKVITVVMTR